MKETAKKKNKKTDEKMDKKTDKKATETKATGRKQTKKQLSWREVIGLTNRAIGIFYKRNPQMIVSRIFMIVWSSLTPYVGILLSALIIDELAGARNIERLKLLVGITLIAEAAIALVSAFLSKWRQTQNAGMLLKIEKLLSEKMLDMDFASLDDTHTSELLSTIRQNMNSSGWGLYNAFLSYEKVISSILTILGGISLTVSLFLSKVPENANRSFAILNNPLVVIGVIAVMLAVTFLAPVFENKKAAIMQSMQVVRIWEIDSFSSLDGWATQRNLQWICEYTVRIRFATNTTETKRARSRRMDCLRIWPGDRLDYVQRLQVPYPFCLLAWSMRLFA